MKFSAVLFAIFTTVAMAELQKVPRSQKPKEIVVRQAGAKTQAAAMSTPDGGVTTFDTAGVNLAGVKRGI